MKKLLINMSFILISVFVWLSVAVSADAFCFLEAGNLYNVSPALLWSIAKVETKFNQSAVNKNSNGTYDVGLMQINSAWKKTLGQQLWDLVTSDACYNVKVGAWILAKCIADNGSTWNAVGCYNARSQNKRQIYANRVYKALKTETDKLSKLEQGNVQ